MAIRYYLVPLTINADGYVRPKYIDQIANSGLSSYVSGETGLELPVVNNIRQFSRNYYILRIVGIQNANWSVLDNRPDTLYLTRQKILTDTTRLAKLGVNLSLLSSSSQPRLFERRLMLWLRDEDRDFSSKFSVAEEIA